jgi:DNA-binding Lrp family transcriptional regulator
MTQTERARLVALRKAGKKLIPQRQAAGEIGVTERQVRRPLRRLRRKGDGAVIHELRGRASNRKLPAEVEQRAVAILSDPVYSGFGPTLATEYLNRWHGIAVSKGTLRHWMGKAGLWKAGWRRVVEVHPWRQRRSRSGELVQWDTSTHDWLEGRGERIYLISMIDDATSRLFARFVRQDTSEENQRLLWRVPGAVRPAVGILHGQGGHVSSDIKSRFAITAVQISRVTEPLSKRTSGQ